MLGIRRLVVGTPPAGARRHGMLDRRTRTAGALADPKWIPSAACWTIANWAHRTCSVVRGVGCPLPQQAGLVRSEFDVDRTMNGGRALSSRLRASR